MSGAARKFLIINLVHFKWHEVPGKKKGVGCIHLGALGNSGLTWKKKMKLKLLFTVCFAAGFQLHAQEYHYLPSSNHPFGLPNPKAPKEISDYQELIGSCDCKSVSRIGQNTWADTVQMIWTFKYIMNGMAVQDETTKADGLHSGSIRQYSADSARWNVHYYATVATPSLRAWYGNRKGDKIILYSEQPSPQGNPGFYRLTFSDISDSGYNWVGEWVDKGETFAYPTWKIFCEKKKV